MAKRLKRKVTGQVGRPTQYPWADWFDGNSWELYRGADYECSGASFSSSAYTAACRAGVRITMSVNGDMVQIRKVGKSK